MVSTLTLGPDFSVKYFAPTDHETNARPALAFVGDLDFSLAREVRDVLETLTPPVCIDLSQVRYLDARILGEFVRLAKRIAPDRPALIGVQPQVRRIVKILALDRIFTLSDSALRIPGTSGNRASTNVDN
jgi:anti-anti-sigma factor